MHSRCPSWTRRLRSPGNSANDLGLRRIDFASSSWHFNRSHYPVAVRNRATNQSPPHDAKLASPGLLPKVLDKKMILEPFEADVQLINKPSIRDRIYLYPKELHTLIEVRDIALVSAESIAFLRQRLSRTAARERRPPVRERPYVCASKCPRALGRRRPWKLSNPVSSRARCKRQPGHQSTGRSAGLMSSERKLHTRYLILCLYSSTMRLGLSSIRSSSAARRARASASGRNALAPGSIMSMRR